MPDRCIKVSVRSSPFFSAELRQQFENGTKTRDEQRASQYLYSSLRPLRHGHSTRSLHIGSR